jgi:hypothetical protein
MPVTAVDAAPAVAVAPEAAAVAASPPAPAPGPEEAAPEPAEPAPPATTTRPDTRPPPKKDPPKKDPPKKDLPKKDPPKPAGPPGFITIDSSPMYSVIYIDGKRYGETPLVRLALSPGKHTVRAVSPSGASRTMTIAIDPGKVAPTRRIEW